MTVVTVIVVTVVTVIVVTVVISVTVVVAGLEVDRLVCSAFALVPGLLK